MIGDVVPEGLELSARRVLVLGLGVTGRSVATVLAKYGAEVLASEERALSDTEAEGLRLHGVRVSSGGHGEAARRLSEMDFVVPSPGISPLRGFLAEVVRSGVPVVSELDLAVRINGAAIVGVTGTNGKTTVCRLAERIGLDAGLKTYACGNNELPFLEAADAHDDADVFVVEASSFRLAFCELFRPKAAVITNLAPDHLDWHESFDDYRRCKERIAARQGPEDLFLFPSAQPELETLAPGDGPKRVPFAGTPMRSREGAWVDGDDVVVEIGESALRASGARALADLDPNLAEDIAAATAAMSFCSEAIDAAAVERALAGFTLEPHRMEAVGKLRGVSFVNDSKGTNPHASLSAIRAFERVVLIAGGRNKGLDLRPLAGEAVRIRTVVVLGEASEELAEVFASTDVPVKTVGSIEEAVGVAFEAASSGDVVLLSPACASLDMFSGYAERGRAFRTACLNLGVKP